ncbi:MAG: 3-isopropylmalate dehydrogenase [Actinomycetaceae bacterium]|nr:3-isopropylmalate dehydrogenase [Actinomycetaceae bacterium]
MRRTIELAVIPGDGIGPEVTAAALKVAHAAVGDDALLNEHHYDLGANRWLRDGAILPDEELESIKTRDAIVLGAIGDPRTPSGLLERGLLLKLRFELDHYINLRPGKYYPAVESPLANPGDIDLVVVREGTEGLYAGTGGSLRKGTKGEVANEVSVNTAAGVERVVRYAFELAQSRPAKKLTLIHKKNVLVHAGGMWQRIVDEVAGEYPEVEVDYNHIDAATIYMVTDPTRYDVIVTDNLFGDILTDEIGAVTGGIGLAPSANLNPTGKFPSMFEPVHGSAPDIAGQGIADPIAAIASMALMFDHLELPAAADRVRTAVDRHMAYRAQNPDMQITTEGVLSSVLDLK